jgi:hypothetical protein
VARGLLHNRGADGLCQACGEPFPCPDASAMLESVNSELDQPTPSSPRPAPAQIGQPPSPRWADREYRCPRCLHWWVFHGVPTEDDYGCSVPTSSMLERERGIYETCDCTFAENNPVTPSSVRIGAQSQWWVT